jgi:hypothetical protein
MLFSSLWDLSQADVKPGQQLEYYFEVSDNDGINGPKTTKSALNVYSIPTASQVAEKVTQNSEALKVKMEKAIKLAGQVEKESKKLGETLLDKKQISFDDKKQIEQFLEKQKQLEQAVKEINNLNKKNTQEKEENNLVKQDLADKQKQIDELFNNVSGRKNKSFAGKIAEL